MKIIWNHKNDEDLGKKFDEQIAKQFNMKTFEQHEFSEDYIEKKNRLLNTMDDESKEGVSLHMKDKKLGKAWPKPVKCAVTALAAVIICSTSAFAINSISNKTKHNVDVEKKGDYAVDLVIKPTEDDDNSAEKTSVKNEEKYWKLNIGYLPEGEAPVAGYDNNKYTIGGVDGGEREVLFLLYDISSEDEEVRISNYSVLLSEDFEINGHKVLYTEYPNCKETYIYFEEADCILWVQTENPIERDEINKIIEGLSVTPGTEEDHTNNDMLKRLRFSNTDAIVENDGEIIKELNDTEINVINVGENFVEKDNDLNTFVGESFKTVDMRYTIDDISIYDNFNDIGDGKLEYDNDCNEFMDASGNILPDHIKYIKNGDGVNTLDTPVSEEDVNQKLVCIKFRIKNESNEDYGANTFRLNMARMIHEDGRYKIVDSVKGIECDRVERSSMIINSQMVYYDFVDSTGHNGIDSLKAGEERSFMVVFCVDECDIPYLYINSSQYGAGENYFYDTVSPQYKPEIFNYVKVQK